MQKLAVKRRVGRVTACQVFVAMGEVSVSLAATSPCAVAEETSPRASSRMGMMFFIMGWATEAQRHGVGRADFHIRPKFRLLRVSVSLWQ